MFSKESFYKKDNWLNSDIYKEEMQYVLPLFKDLYLAHNKQVKDWAIKRNIHLDDIEKFTKKVILNLALKQYSGDFVEVDEASTQKYISKIMGNLSLQYYEKNKKQNNDMKNVEEGKDYETYNSWRSDNNDDEKEEKTNRQLGFMYECKEEIMSSNKEQLKVNINLLFTRYFALLSNKQIAEMINTTEGGMKRRNDASYAILKKCIEYKMQFLTYKNYVSFL